MVSVEKVLSYFKSLNHVVLATVDKESPRLRPVTMVKHIENFYFATGVDANKVKQLEVNPEVEFILQWKEEANNGYIRVVGLAFREESKAIITDLYTSYNYFSKLWKGPEDPTLVVYKVEP
jgi:general stress protein 26